MEELFNRLLELMGQNRDCVFVSIIASSGSVPRGAGAHMLVSRQGLERGTIGGGAVEYKALELAAQVLEEKSFFVQQFALRKNEVEDIGMVCGGDVEVYFRYISPDDRIMKAAAEKAAACFGSGEESWLMMDVTGGKLAVYGEESGPAGNDIPAAVLKCRRTGTGLTEMEGHTFYIEPLVQAGRVYIFGGGHVAQKLVPALSAVHFRCVVIEDRQEFCDPALFPGVEQTRLIPMDRLSEELSITLHDYICIMTRGHKDDMTAQAFAMGTPARYIGVIGSRKKVASVTARLKEQGFRDEDFLRVTSPIGLDIGAETPEEIAVSITAQLIAVRAGKQ